MFGISHAPELIILLVVALIVFGPKRLPQIGSGVGRGIRNFRHETEAMKAEIDGVKSELTETAKAATQSSD